MHAQHIRDETANDEDPYTTMFVLNICLPLSETSILPNFICYEKKREEARKEADWNNNTNNGIINYYYCSIIYIATYGIIIILLQEQGRAICTKPSANVPSSIRQHISLSSQDLELDSKVGKQRRQR